MVNFEHDIEVTKKGVFSSRLVLMTLSTLLIVAV